MAQGTDAQTHTQLQPEKNLYPSTLPKTRKALTTILNEYRANPDYDTARFRAQVSALRAIGELHRYDIDERLEALERAIESQNTWSSHNARKTKTA